MIRKSIRTIITFSLALILLISDFHAFAGGGIASVETVSTSAESSILIDGKSGRILYKNNESHQMAMASTTKIMTAIVVLENTPLSDEVTITKEMCGIEGSSAYLFEGEKISVKDLLYAVMLQSANDASVALAIHTKGSVEAFVELMNKKADELGLTNTHFMNPNGLPQDGHYSSAGDMAKIMAYSMKNRDFANITGTKVYKTEKNDSSEYRVFSNHNKLLNSYEYCIGGKTGFTKSAGRCLVTVAEKNDIILIAVTLNAPDDWADHKSMFEYGFSLYREHSIGHSNDLKYRVNVVGGDKNYVDLSPLCDVSVNVLNEENISFEVFSQGIHFAPIIAKEDENNPAGKLVIYQDGIKLKEIELYYDSNVDPYINTTFEERIESYFKDN